MSNLVKLDSDEWGTDPHSSLVAARASGNALILDQATDKVLCRYRSLLRNLFEQNAEVIAVLGRHDLVTNAFDDLKTLFSELIRSESADLFDSILRELLNELEEMKKSPGSLYLVETDTGKATLRIGPEHVYYPAAFIGDDGKLHKPVPILHPGISAPIIQKRHQDARVSQAITRGGKMASLALAHLSDPNSIRIQVLNELHELGISTDLESPTKFITIEFGKEAGDGALQSLNPKFHRFFVFAKQLLNKVRSELNGKNNCSISDVELKSNAKKRWYTVTIGMHE